MSKAKTKLKCVMLGEGRVGKTSLLSRFLTNSFDEGEESTLEAKMHQGLKMEANGALWDVFLWDTAGQERFRALGPAYYRDADGAILVYDITDKDSFTRVRTWLREVHKVVGENISIVVAGNKCDLERERKVTKREAEDWCSEHGCKHVLVSAKLGLRVTEAYQTLVGEIASRRGVSSGNAGGAASRGGGGADFGGDLMNREPRQRGVKITLNEEPGRGAGMSSNGGGGGGSSSGGGGGGNGGGGCPC